MTPMAGAERRGGVGWGWWSLGATTASRADSSAAAPAAAVPAAAAASAAAAAAPAAPEPVKMDPFRPARAAVDPVVINILVKILGSGEDAERVANKAVRKRMRNPETELTVEERRLIYKRVYGVEVLRGRLSFLLEQAVKVLTYLIGWQTGDARALVLRNRLTNNATPTPSPHDRRRRWWIGASAPRRRTSGCR